MAKAFPVDDEKDDYYQFAVAIDVGTAYTKTAWIRNVPDNPLERVHCFDKWTGAKNHLQVPTAVLYELKSAPGSFSQTWKFVAFGQEALDRYRSAYGTQKMALFRSFKMTLHEKKEFGQEITIKSSNTSGFRSVVELPALEIFASLLQELSSIMLRHLNKTYGQQSIGIESIKWVLTVPALWKATARNFMRQAAKKAGLYKESKPRQLALALEPETAALHVRQLQSGDLLFGEPSTAKKYIVVDVGAGTIDVAVHEIREHEESGTEYVHEIKSCIGNAKGAKTIDDSFQDFMKNLKVKVPNFFTPERDYALWVKLMDNFHKAKVNFDGKEDMRVELPSQYLVQYKEEAKKELYEVLKMNKRSTAYLPKSSHFLTIVKSECSTWYNTTCKSVISIVKGLVWEHRIDALFLVGGFADCDLLREALQSTNLKPIQHPVIPDNPGLAVVQGAVKYGPILKAIASRRSPSTYGVNTNMPFKENDHLEEKRYYSKFNRKDYCRDIFSVFVRNGQEVDPSNPYKDTFYPMEAEQSKVTFRIYACESTHPKYVTDIGCRKIGTVSVNIQPLAKDATKDDDSRQIKLTMDFSGPEIFVCATVITDGKIGEVSECTLDFLEVEKYTIRQ